MTRDWRQHWRSVAPIESETDDAAMRQVGKTLLGQPVGPDQIDAIVERIIGVLELDRSDRVLDIGCGNGLVTERIARAVDAVVAIDVSPVLIDDARRYRNAPNLTYHVADAVDGISPDLVGRSPTAAYAYEMVQHLTVQDTGRMLSRLADRSDRDDFRLLLASIPDRDRLRSFYDTPQRWERYRRLSAEGNEQIGTWWTADELTAVASESGFTCRTLPQPEGLYTAHYRFDALLTMPR